MKPGGALRAYEYRLQPVDPENVTAIVFELNQLGAQGWHVVAALTRSETFEHSGMGGSIWLTTVIPNTSHLLLERETNKA